ncbi:hypothetical protein ABTD15_19125 [Acinetobacter baumannii]
MDKPRRTAVGGILIAWPESGRRWPGTPRWAYRFGSTPIAS